MDRKSKILFNSSENPPLSLKKTNNEWFINTTPIQKERVDFFLNDLKTLRATSMQPQAEVQLLNPELKSLLMDDEGRHRCTVGFFMSI